jgi:CheY-like chemotaxis protein
VLQKPISRHELSEALVNLGLLTRSTRPSLRVLVVDDDPKAVELIAVRIGGLAREVMRAHGGSEAIEIARREMPDVIVLDLMMPEVNGFDVVDALHKHPETARIPILVVTAKVITMEDRAKLRRYLAGTFVAVTSILEKGTFDSERFLSEVRQAMSGRGMVA